MNSLRHIRKNVFGLKQQEFAAIAGVPQSAVSRWENGLAAPSLEEMNRIRAEAGRRKLKARWNDRLFFDAPQTEANYWTVALTNFAARTSVMPICRAAR